MATEIQRSEYTYMEALWMVVNTEKFLTFNFILILTFILLTWTIWRARTNASKWRMVFNSAFKGLIECFNNKFCYTELTNLLHFTINALKSHRQLLSNLQLVCVWVDFHISLCWQQNVNCERETRLADPPLFFKRLSSSNPITKHSNGVRSGLSSSSILVTILIYKHVHMDIFLTTTYTLNLQNTELSYWITLYIHNVLNTDFRLRYLMNKIIVCTSTHSGRALK